MPRRAVTSSFVKGAPQHAAARRASRRNYRQTCAGTTCTLRFALPVRSKRRKGSTGQLLEDRLCAANPQKSGDRSKARVLLRIERFDGHQPLRLVRQRPQQHRVDDAEDRRVRADAQRQRDDAINVKPGFFNNIRAP